MGKTAVVEFVCVALTFIFSVQAQTWAEQPLYVSKQISPGEYTGGIEGPAVDANGRLYVVNLYKSGTIGRLLPGSAKSELFAELPAGSIGSGIRIDRDGRMYVADFKKHNIYKFDVGSAVPRLYVHSAQFNQPNDLAVHTDGTLYVTDPNFKRRNGQLWRITRDPTGAGRAELMMSGRALGVVNGIDLSPDQRTLYVSESNTREVWAYQLAGAKLLAPRLVQKFDEFELDGLRTDIEGRLFVTRPGHGTVAVLSADGKFLRQVSLLGKEPSNLTFGGKDGKTVYITQVDGRFVESFQSDQPGREFCWVTTRC